MNKVGFDDYFVAGGTVEGLDALATPWDGSGPGVWLRDSKGGDDVATLRQQLAAARADISALAQVALNPEVTRNQLILAVAVATEALAKQTRGEIEPNGKIILSAPVIADDWRPEPEKGGRVAPVNPRNGRRPRMARDKVTPAMTEAVAHGLIAARELKVPRKHINGTGYTATDWVVEPVASLAAALNPWTTYRRDDPKPRKLRTITPPCPHCGEVHPITQIDYCGGCSAKRHERTIEPVVAEPGSLEPTPDNLSGVSSPQDSTPQPLSSPAPIRIVRRFSGGTDHNALQEPEWLLAAPDPWGEVG